VYLRDGVSEPDVASLVAALEKTPSVERVRYVSATEARREILADDADAALANLPPNAFPASLEVSFDAAIDGQAVDTIALKLRALPQVETVETYERWTERLSSLLAGGVTASGCLALVVLAAVVSVVGATMRMLLQQRRIEVEVLRLVGATNAFVRRPFVVEGAVQGAAGAAAAVLLLGLLFALVRGRFDSALVALFGVEPSFLPWYVALGMVTLGGALGATTAFVSLRKIANV
jgi:cell division transport system permease protein